MFGNSSNMSTWQQLQLPEDLFPPESTILCKAKISNEVMILLVEKSNSDSDANVQRPDRSQAFGERPKHFVLFNMSKLEFSKVECEDTGQFIDGSQRYLMFYQEKELLICAYEGSYFEFSKYGFSQDYKTLSITAYDNLKSETTLADCTTVLLNKTILFLFFGQSQKPVKNGNENPNNKSTGLPGEVKGGGLFGTSTTGLFGGAGISAKPLFGHVSSGISKETKDIPEVSRLSHIALEIITDDSKNTSKWKEYRFEGFSRPNARIGYSTALWKNQLFLVGGRMKKSSTSNSSSSFCTNVWVLDLDTRTWTKSRNETPPSVNGFAAASPSGKKIYLFGAKGSKDLIEINPVWSLSKSLFVYDVAKDTWKEILTNSKALPTFTIPEDTDPNLLDKLVVTKDKLFILDSEKNSFFLSLENTEEREGLEYEEEDGEPDLLRKQKNLFNQMLFPDVVFKVEGEEISAHKAVLCAGSKFFRNMFTSGMEETTKKVIEFSDIKAIVFKSLIEYIYCNTTGVNDEIAFDLFKAADKYSLPGLRRICEDFLKKNTTIENAIDIVNFAEKHEADGLRSSALKFIAKNFEKVFETERPIQLKASTMLEIYRKK